MARSDQLSRSDRPSGWLDRSPFSDLFDSPGRMNRWMHDFFRDRNFPALPALPVDVTEDDGHYVLSAELPGVERKDLTVECRDGLLSIQGEKRSQREERNEKARLLERSFGAFSRTLALPDDADVDHVNASFRDGVLRIEIQKKPSQEPRTKTIAIEE